MKCRTFWLIAFQTLWGSMTPLTQAESGQMDVVRLPPVHRGESDFVQQASFVEDAAAPDILQRMARLENEWEAFLQDHDAELVPHCSTLQPAPCVPERWARCQLYAGGEIIVMKSRFANGAERDRMGEVLDFNMTVVPRVWLGYWNPGDNGLRARYWQYRDDSAPTPAEPVTWDEPLRFMRLDAGTVDLEIAQRLNLAGWHLTVGVGGRYSWLDQQVASVDTDAVMFKRFHGIGPVVAVDMRRPFGCRGFSWVANLRGSLLVGESRWRDPYGAVDSDDIGAIAEIQIGLEWRTPFGARSELVVSGMYEQQMWFQAGTRFHEDAPNRQFTPDLRARSHDVAFMGFVASVQLIR